MLSLTCEMSERLASRALFVVSSAHCRDYLQLLYLLAAATVLTLRIGWI